MQNILRKLAIATTFSLPLAAAGAHAAVAEDLYFDLFNKSGSPLVEFHVDPASQKNWGENILSGTIGPGEAGKVTIADGKTTCKYDIRGVFADGAVVDDFGLDLCQLGSYTYSK